MSKSFNTNAINTAITGAFKAATTYATYVAELQTLLRGADRETIKEFVCPVAAKQYGAVYADGKWADPKCAAKRYANRLIAAIVGKSDNRKEEVEVPAELLAAAAKLAKLAAQYEGARSLASKALAVAFAN